MTISSTTRKAGPFSGNNVTVAFPFTFKVFEQTDIAVVATDANDVETTKTLTTHYTVSLNADQDASPGGTVTMLTAPATGTLLTIASAVPELQAVALTNMGGFYPTVINGALDRLTILIQQVAEEADRAVKVAISSSTTPDDLLTEITANVAASAVSAAAASASETGASASASAASASADAAAAYAASINPATLQPLDDQLTTLAGITAQQATDLAAVSTFMGAVLNDADAATARATLGVESKRLLQNLNVTTGALATGTTLIPQDDTIPQITEGDQYMVLGITPTSTTSLLEVTVTWFGSHSVLSGTTVALFRDAVADALAATQVYNEASHRDTQTFSYRMTSGTTSEIIFRVRAGGADAGTTTFNGAAGARFYGGQAASSITIKEYAA